MRPLLRCFARPMKEEWKMRPYLGVLPRVFRALEQQRSSPQPPAGCASRISAQLQHIWSLQKWAHGTSTPNALRGCQVSLASTYQGAAVGTERVHCRPEESLLSPQDLHCAGRVLCQVDKGPCGRHNTNVSCVDCTHCQIHPSGQPHA